MEKMEQCRVCLKKVPICLSLTDERGSKICTMLNALTNGTEKPMEFHEDDTMRTICYKCFANVKLAYSIQQKIKLSEDYITHSLRNSNDKEEQIVVDEPIEISLEFDGLNNVTYCRICREDFDCFEELMKHTTTHFSGPQICTFCDVVFFTMKDYRAHYCANRPREQLEHCASCETTFRYHTLHEVHQETHFLEIPISVVEPKQHAPDHRLCEYCGVLLPPRPFRWHLFNHSDTIFYCDLCPSTFRTKKYLRTHIKRFHNKQSKKRNFVCETCGKGFFQKSELVRHIRQHTTESPYKCELCGDAFKQRVLLRLHRKKKHFLVEEENVPCPSCERKFISELALTAHLRRAHYNKKINKRKIKNKDQLVV